MLEHDPIRRRSNGGSRAVKKRRRRASGPAEVKKKGKKRIKKNKDWDGGVERGARVRVPSVEI
jgi:hypothetical protein